MKINANDHPFKVVSVKEGAPYANDHPYKVEMSGSSDYATKEELNELDKKVDALASDLSYKGTVPSYDNLPNNPSVADTYLTEDSGTLYTWSGSEWIALNAGGWKRLTTSNYNYPVANPDGIATWLLEDGVYLSAEDNMKIYFSSGDTKYIQKDSTLMMAQAYSSAYQTTFHTAFLVCSGGVYWARTTDDGLAFLSNYQDSNVVLNQTLIVDSLDVNDPYRVLSAKQGKVLNEKIGDVETALHAINNGTA